MGTRAVVCSEYWGKKTQLMKVRVRVRRSHESINPRPNRASEAAADAQSLATKQGSLAATHLLISDTNRAT